MSGPGKDTAPQRKDTAPQPASSRRAKWALIAAVIVFVVVTLTDELIPERVGETLRTFSLVSVYAAMAWFGVRTGNLTKDALLRSATYSGSMLAAYILAFAGFFAALGIALFLADVL